jgi:hypothetical protein
MLKKVFIAAFGIVSCLQNVSCISSEICTCENWDKISERICELFPSFHGVVVGVNCDGILCKDIKRSAKATDPRLSIFLTEFSKHAPVFCMTSIPGCEYISRRVDFELSGIADFFEKNSAKCFSRAWTNEEDEEKDYFIDYEWNTAYTWRVRNRFFSESNPLNYYEINREDEAVRKICSEYKNQRIEAVSYQLSKGETLERMILDGFLKRPDFFVFVDDCKKNLEIIQETCLRMEIPYRGIWCEAYKQ